MGRLGLRGLGLSILFTDDEGIRQLNRDFRGLDRPTNVLAFPDGKGAIGFKRHLGDIALSTQTLWREAEAHGAEPGEFLYYYLIHAILHLFGYDHERDEAEDRVQREETERLLSLIRRDL
jgi:probable rRNA maturation factor